MNNSTQDPATNRLVRDRPKTALVVTDPQNDFLADNGVAWGLVGENVTKNNVRHNIEELLRAAKLSDSLVFISPHFYFPHDQHWQERGAVQEMLSGVGIFKVASPLNTGSINNTGADFYEPYKKYILDGETVITSPHKVYGPETNDLVLQLRKRGVQSVILAGFAANLCTEGHLRELKEQGFEVTMVSDAVGAPGEDAYNAAMTNSQMIANAVWDTREAVAFFEAKKTRNTEMV